MILGYQNTRVPGARIPDYQDTMGTRIPGYQDTRIPWYQDTKISGYHGIPGY